MLYILVDSWMDYSEKDSSFDRSFADIIGVYDNVHNARRARDMMLEICRYSDVEKNHHHYDIFYVTVKNVTKCPPCYDKDVVKDMFHKYGHI